jgi:hypothetical protein
MQPNYQLSDIDIAGSYFKNVLLIRNLIPHTDSTVYVISKKSHVWESVHDYHWIRTRVGASHLMPVYQLSRILNSCLATIELTYLSKRLQDVATANTDVMDEFYFQQAKLEEVC